MQCNETIFSDHAINQMFKRNLSVPDIKQVLEGGEVIKNYSEDRPYQSCLMLGFVNNRPLHVVVAIEVTRKLCIIVTAYIPTKDLWEDDYKTKKKS